MTSDIVEGLRFLWRTPVLRSLAAITGVYNLATSATFAVLVLYAVGPDSPMGLTDAAYGFLLTTLAAGSLIGTFVAGWIERMVGRARSLRLGVLCGAAVVGIPAVTTDPFVIGAVFVLGGISIVVVNIVTVSLRQRITPDRLLGRVNSGYRLVGWGTMPLGAALGGVLAELCGLRAVFAIMALVVLALAGLDGDADGPGDERRRGKCMRARTALRCTHRRAVLGIDQTNNLAFWLANSSGVNTPLSRRSASWASSSAELFDGAVAAVLRTYSWKSS